MWSTKSLDRTPIPKQCTCQPPKHQCFEEPSECCIGLTTFWQQVTECEQLVALGFQYLLLAASHVQGPLFHVRKNCFDGCCRTDSHPCIHLLPFEFFYQLQYSCTWLWAPLLSDCLQMESEHVCPCSCKVLHQS